MLLPPSPSIDHALPVPTPKQKIENGAKIGRHSLKIHSTYLRNILQAVIKYHSGTPTEPTKVPGSVTQELVHDLMEGLFQYPFRELYRHVQDMENYKTNPLCLRSTLCKLQQEMRCPHRFSSGIP